MASDELRRTRAKNAKQHDRDARLTAHARAFKRDLKRSVRESNASPVAKLQRRPNLSSDATRDCFNKFFLNDETCNQKKSTFTQRLYSADLILSAQFLIAFDAIFLTSQVICRN